MQEDPYAQAHWGGREARPSGWECRCLGLRARLLNVPVSCATLGEGWGGGSGLGASVSLSRMDEASGVRLTGAGGAGQTLCTTEL